MYYFKLSVSKRFSKSVTWNTLCILPCSVSLTFATFLKNHTVSYFELNSLNFSNKFFMEKLYLHKSKKTRKNIEQYPIRYVLDLNRGNVKVKIIIKVKS